MRVDEVPLLLSALSQFQFTEASEVAVQMWFGALDPDLPVTAAVEAVADYYATPSWEKPDPLTPGMVNKAWRDRKHAERERAATERDEIERRPIVRTGVPEWWKAMRADLAKPPTDVRTGEPMAVSDIIAGAMALSGPRSATPADRAGARCPWPECPCTHTHGCFRGWIDKDGQALPCPICRPGLTDLLSVLPPPGQRTQNDFTRIRNRAKAEKQ